MGKGIIKETKSELKKVIWPNAKDVANGTAAVLVISGIVGLFVFVTDFASLELVKLITDKVAALIA